MTTISRLARAREGLARTTSALPALCAALPPGSGDVLTEEAGIARACGRGAAIHPFIMAALSRRGLWDEAPFVASLLRADQASLLLPFDIADAVPGAVLDAVTDGAPDAGRAGSPLARADFASSAHAERWTEGMLRAIAARYVTRRRVGAWRVLVRR